MRHWAEEIDLIDYTNNWQNFKLMERLARDELIAFSS